jgi:hypothetical protein
MSTPSPVATQDLNVASDATTIYEGGKLIPLSIPDLLGNEVALRQLINSHNLSNRQADSLRAEVSALQLERAATVATPALAVFLAITNVSGAILIAMGVNYMTSATAVPRSWVITVVGGLLTLVTAVAPVALPFLITWFREKSDAN